MPEFKNMFIRVHRFVVTMVAFASIVTTQALADSSGQSEFSEISELSELSTLSDSSDKAIAAFLARPALAHASVGISVVRLSDGAPLASHNAQLALTPASTMKALTTATALRLFGADARFETLVGYRGSVGADGTLRGDLIVCGGGDATLASRRDSRGADHFFCTVVDALKQAGIKRIEGRILADDSALPTEGVLPGWTWEDLGNYFAAGLYALNYSDNTYELTLDTSRKGVRPAVKSINPPMPELRIHNYLLDKNVRSDSAYLYGAPFSDDRYLYGALPHSAPAYTIKGDMPDPPYQLAAQLTRHLASQGIAVTADPTTVRRLLEANANAVSDATARTKAESSIRKQADPDNELLRYPSAPFSAIARQTNLYSLNLFAEGLLRTLAPEPTQAVRRELAYWQSRGLDTDGLRVDDGSGLSPTNRLTPAFLTALMVEMQADRAFRASLPAVGREGTVGSLLRSTPLAGKLRLKSGTIRGVVCYVGYIEVGEPRALCIMVNNFSGSSSEMRRAIEKLLTDMLL